MSGVKVYLRPEDDAEGQLLAEVPLSEVDGVLDKIGQWGVDTEEGMIERSRLVGQFALDDRGAVFEVVIVPKDDGS